MDGLATYGYLFDFDQHSYETIDIEAFALLASYLSISIPYIHIFHAKYYVIIQLA